MCRTKTFLTLDGVRNTARSLRVPIAAIALAALSFFPAIGRAQTSVPATQPQAATAPSVPFVSSVPNGFQGATVQYKPNAQVPLDLSFVDESGKTVKLQDYFHGKPVILSMVYYQCPMLCGLTMNGLLDAVRPMTSLKMGQDYEIVTVSFNPREKPELAATKKEAFAKAFGSDDLNKGWHFLTSKSDDEPRALGDAIGFGYKLNPSNDQYLHQAAIYICMPDGHVSRMIPEVTFDTDVLHDSLVNASQGKLGTTIFKFAQSCGLYDYDPASGKYVARARNVMRLGGLLTVLILAGFLGRFWYQDTHKKPSTATASDTPDAPDANA